MPKTQPTARKPGRNDPCWCGSGRKYKDCHLQAEQEARSEQMRLRSAQDTLLPKIVEAARGFSDAIPVAFERFWQGKYGADQMANLEEYENRGSERFMVWFAFDYPLGEDGRTLVEQLVTAADGGEFALEPAERALIGAWTGVRLRAYRVEERHKGQTVTLRDLLDEKSVVVPDSGASRRLEPAEVVVGHLVPVDRNLDTGETNYYFAGAAAQLTADTAEKLVEFAELHLADMRRSDPQASWADLLRARSEVLNHFVMALPVEEHNPTIMENIVNEGRANLELTKEAIARLLGREPAGEAPPAPPEGEAKRDDGPTAAP